MKRGRSTVESRMEALAACDLFGGLGGASRRALAGRMVLREAEKGDLLFFQGDRADGFYVVVRGRVRVYRLSPDGREQVLHLFGPGEVVGEVPVFQGGDYPACASAEGRVEALYLPGERFLELGEEHPAILMEMLAVLSMRLRKFVGLIDDLSLKEVSARLAKHLLDLRSRAGADRFRLDSSKTVLAAKIGTISATLSRTLARMQKRGVISVKGEEIAVSDPDALIALAGGEKL